MKSKVAPPAPQPAPAPERPPESPNKRNKREQQEYVAKLEKEQNKIVGELTKQQDDISIYTRAIAFIGAEKKDSHTEMTAKDKQRINEILKEISKGTKNIGNLQYYDAAYKKIEDLSAETKKVMKKLEEQQEAIEKEKNGPAPRVPPKSKARLSGLNKEDEIREEQAVKERVMKGVVSSVGGGGTKKKEDR